MTASTPLLAALALAAVLGLILLIARALRGTGLMPRTGAGGGRLGLVQVLALDPRRRLHLVRCDGRELLLLTGGTNDQVIGWLDPAPANNAP